MDCITNTLNNCNIIRTRICFVEELERNAHHRPSTANDGALDHPISLWFIRRLGDVEQ